MPNSNVSLIHELMPRIMDHVRPALALLIAWMSTAHAIMGRVQLRNIKRRVEADALAHASS